MTGIYWQVAAQLGAAWVAGGIIGFERSYHGRAAGFRTHALVCLASAAAMTLTLANGFAGHLPGGLPRVDPTPQLGQGVLTGIGFLGAGVIFKEGVNVRGLTTAASIWATAAAGMMFGVGEFFGGALAVAGILVTLIFLRWFEDASPSQFYAWGLFRFEAARAPSQEGLKTLLKGFGVDFRDVSYARVNEGQTVQFKCNLSSRRARGFDDLAAHLLSLDGLTEFELDRISK